MNTSSTSLGMTFIQEKATTYEIKDFLEQSDVPISTTLEAFYPNFYSESSADAESQKQ